MSQYREIAANGLWTNNPALVQLLGLCPLLAVSSTVINAMGMGLATALVLVCSNASVSLVRNVVTKDIRIPVFVMLIAGFVTAVELLMRAYAYSLYQTLGIFIPLIVTNCTIIGRAEAFASKNPILPSAFDGLMTGLGFTAVLMILGAIRELAGKGTLFDGADILLGSWAANLRIEVVHWDHSFLLALMPPGAFIGMALLIAMKNTIDQFLAERRQSKPVAKAERARVTAQ